MERTDTRTGTDLITGHSELPVRWGWLLALGIAMIVLGFVGLSFTTFYTLAGIIGFGALALTAGLMQLWHGATVRETGWSGRGMHLVAALAYLVLGALLLWDPVAGSLSLTLFLAAFLAVLGISRARYAWRCRSQGWRWRMASVTAFFDLVLAALIFAGWPGSALWVIGLFLAVEMIFTGSLLSAVAWTARSERRFERLGGEPDDRYADHPA